MEISVTREQAVYEAWRRGRLRYKLRPYQRVIYDNIRKFEQLGDKGPPIIFINISRQCGKSFLDSIILLEDCIRVATTYVTFVSSTKIDAKDIIKKVMTDIMSDCPEELKPKWRNDDHAYVFDNGSELAVLGADDDDQVRRIRGRPRHKNSVDEARNIRHLSNLVDSVLIPSMVTTGGKIILSTTPADSPAHKSKDYYDECKLQGALFELTIWDEQKSCPTEFTRDRLNYLAKASGGYKSTAWMREYEAKWVVESERAIVPEWSEITDTGPTRGKTLTEEVPTDHLYHYYKKYTCMDMGVEDATWVGFGYYHFVRAQLIIEREWVKSGPEITTQLIAESVQHIETDLGWINLEQGKQILRIADNNNRQMLNDLTILYGTTFAPVSKTKDGKIGSLQAHVNRLREWIKNERIVINPNCKFLIGCLETGIWTENRDKFDHSLAYKHFDAIAGLMYLLKYVDQQTNPIPHILSYDPHTEVLPSAARKIYNKDKDGINSTTTIKLNRQTTSRQRLQQRYNIDGHH